MTRQRPLSAFSEVVDQRRRWNADWYSWLDDLESRLAVLEDKFPRQVLTASISNFYVRADGNNSNTGLTNTSSGAWLTLQGATDNLAAQYNASNNLVVVNVGPGTYGRFTLRPLTGLQFAAGLVYVGDIATPSNVVIDGSGSSCVSATTPDSRCQFKGFKFTTTGTQGLVASNGGHIEVADNCEFGTVSGANGRHMEAGSQGRIIIRHGYSISGSAALHLWASTNGYIEDFSGGTITATAALTFSQAFAAAINNATLIAFGATYNTSGGGSYTGKRFDSSHSSAIDTFGSGVNYFPGTIPGTTDATSTYN